MEEQFYINWAGHQIELIDRLCAHFKNHPVIWLVGDSTLDNKYWLHFQGYCPIKSTPLDPSQIPWKPPINDHWKLLFNKMIPDVAFHINTYLNDSDLSDYVCLNTAIEASLLRARHSKLLPQDQFVRDHISPSDIVVVSIGGNDVALSPTAKTIASILYLVRLKKWPRTRPDDGTLLNLKETISSTWAFHHLHALFHDRIVSFIRELTVNSVPKLVVVCMLYFPDLLKSPSWANIALSALQYDSKPWVLQFLIELIYETAIKTVKEKINGTRVVTVPFFERMDGKDTSMYVQRAEPSEKGGRHIAELIVDAISTTLKEP